MTPWKPLTIENIEISVVSVNPQRSSERCQWHRGFDLIWMTPQKSTLQCQWQHKNLHCGVNVTTETTNNRKHWSFCGASNPQRWSMQCQWHRGDYISGVNDTVEFILSVSMTLRKLYPQCQWHCVDHLHDVKCLPRDHFSGVTDTGRGYFIQLWRVHIFFKWENPAKKNRKIQQKKVDNLMLYPSLKQQKT
jgi:hypothetical protein